MSRLREKYDQEVAPALKKELGLGNVHQIPRLVKVVINVGVGRAVSDSKAIETAAQTVTKITGQAPVQTVAKKSIAGFKLREGNKIGVKVTLRGQRMYAFLDRLISVTLPRIRDFRGIPVKAFDRQGNYSIGINEQSVFPELTFEETAQSHGLQITIMTSTDDSAQSKRLLELLGFPFRRQG